MTPEQKEESRRRTMERLRERHEFWLRHDRMHPTDVPQETREHESADPSSVERPQ